MINILITEDSDVVTLLLKTILEHEPDFNVIGHARNGREAVEMTHELKPDLVTMDIRMPVMDGFEATRIIMNQDPTPIVVISTSIDNEEMRITFRAIEEGALAVLEKPRGLGHPDFENVRREIVDTIRAMAEVKVIRRMKRRNHEVAQLEPVDIFEKAIIQKTRAYEIVAIGASTGGPQALQKLLSSLPVGFPIPLVIAQHMSAGFIHGLVYWLQGATLLDVKLAEDGEPLRPGTVYFAPDDHHLVVTRNGNGLRVKLTDDLPVNRFRPSATPLLQSVADVCGGSGVGCLLTGMGVDGAQGLLEIRQAKGHTIIQDKDSCIVFGMPGAALALNAVDQIVRLEQLAAYLTSLARR